MRAEQDLGRIARYHRKKAGLTQQALARLAGVGKTAVFDLEKGKESIRLDTLRKIFKVLNVTITLESPLMKEYRKEGADEKS